MTVAVDHLERDRIARARALDVASFIVEAPAGAGKTELLTQRFLRLLATVDHPEEVVALTFTNKAATEMRDRILQSLEIAARNEAPGEEHRKLTFDLAHRVLARDGEHAWGLRAHPGRLRITTLDALCASLARQMPFLSRFGSQPAVTEEAAAHYATAARRTLEMVEDGDANAGIVAAALDFMANDAGHLERLLVAMLGKREQWLRHAHRIDEGIDRAELEAGFAALIGRDIAAAAARLDEGRQRALLPLARFAAANAPGLCDPLADRELPLRADIADLPCWQALVALLLTGGGTFRKSVDKRVGFPADKESADRKAAFKAILDDLAGIAGLEAALAKLSVLPRPQLSAAEWATVECFARVLRLAAGQLWLVFQEAGEVDFVEIAGRAGQALGEDEAPTDLAQALDYRIRHLLVDEFQDTSPGQVELIQRLMRGWMPGDGRTLFVVGDPMQSIYRFRKADVGLFLNVRQRGIGGMPLAGLRLYRNNRSFAGIVDWVNATFPAIFPADDATGSGAVRYAEAAATRPARADAGVTVHALIAPPGGDGATTEACVALDVVRAARRDCPDGRVAVLVRARSHLDALVAEIRRTAPDLRFSAVEIESLAGRQHVQDLLTLFFALHHRADRVHWLALLRAPWCGLTLADLHALAAGDRQRTLWQLMHDEGRLAALSADGRARLLHVRAVLALAFSERGRRHPRRWLEGVWLMLDGPRCLESPAALADVEAFFDLADRLTATGALTPEALAEHAGELFAPPDPLGDAVQLMTIHKAKGLEFDTVIVPGLQRTIGGDDSPLLLWEEVAGPDGREYLLAAPMRAKGTGDEGPTAYDYLRRLEVERAGHEAERVLYVAATRAIRRLHLIGVAEADGGKEDGLKPPATGSFLHLLWNTVRSHFRAALATANAAPAPTPAVDPATFVPPLVRLAAPGIPAALRRLPPGQPTAANPPGFDDDSAPALEASVGTLVHRCLELIAKSRLESWPEARIAGLEPAWRRWLAGRGHAAAEATAGAAEAARAVRTTLASPAGRWLLADHPQAGAEQEWSRFDGTGAVNHVIDRVFVAEGCRWIIDYKTLHAPAAQLAERAEGFRAQLERYAELFADDPLPLRKAIFFPLQGALVEIR